MQTIYRFQWPAVEVDKVTDDIFISGSFDNWATKKRLTRQSDNTHSIDLPIDFQDNEKIYFKFIINDDWCLNNEYPSEIDSQGNKNNFITVNDTVHGAKRKVKIKKRVRRNKKTGERIVVSQEYVLLNDDGTEGERIDMEIDGTVDAIPPNDASVPIAKDELVSSTITTNASTTDPASPTLSTSPKVESKESEVQSLEDSVKEPVKEPFLKEEKIADAPSVAQVPKSPKVKTKKSKSKTKKSVKQPVKQEEPKKKGIMGKFKKLFN